MDHSYIEEVAIVDHYLLGQLTPEESARFEEHFMDCPACLDNLTVKKGFINGLRLMASQEAAAPPRWGRWVADIREMAFPKTWAVAAGFTFLAALIGAATLLAGHIRRLRVDADQTRIASARWEQRYGEAMESAAQAGIKQQQEKNELNGEVGELRARIDELQESARTAGSGQSIRPQVNVASFQLESGRGPGQPGSKRVNEMALPSSSASFVIFFETEAGYGRYRVSVVSEDGKTLWRDLRSMPDSSNSMTVIFNSRFFQPGGYNLTVEGVTKEGGFHEISNYPFHVTKHP